MKTSTVLGILLVCSMTLNYWLWREYDERGELAECFATRGFEPQGYIDDAQAREFMAAYKDSLTAPDTTLGGIITRSAFDEILCTADCNAISYTFATDVSGRTGPGGNGVFVIFSGLNVKYDEETKKIIDYKDLGIKKYITQHWCPPTCNPY